MTTTIGTRPCDGNHPGREAYRGEYEPGSCRICWLFLNDPTYNEMWGGTGIRPVKPKCRHLGSRLDEQGWCPTCPSGTQGHHVPLLGCALHQKTAGQRFAHGVRTCIGCADYQVPDALAQPVVRNLVYACYPLRGPGWRWNIDQLLRRIELFNGRRIVAIITDAFTDSPNEVVRALGDRVDEVVQLQNFPELREMVAFEPLFRRVQSRHPSHVTFFGHTKGVTREGQPAIRRWAQVLYEASLDHWRLVEDLLQRYPVVGAFKKVGRGWPDFESRCLYHFSGSFWWTRNRDLFTKSDWVDVPRFWSGIETAAGTWFRPDEAGCLFWEKPVPQMNLYDIAYWESVVTPAWEKWKADHVHLRTR